MKTRFTHCKQHTVVQSQRCTKSRLDDEQEIYRVRILGTIPKMILLHVSHQSYTKTGHTSLLITQTWQIQAVLMS